MASMIKITGVSQVIAKSRVAEASINARVLINMKRAGLYIQRESQKIVPVEFSVLKNSAFTRSVGTLKKPDVIIGYTAKYAIYVHEMLQNKHKAGKSAKFLEKIIKNKRLQIMAILAGKR